MVPPSPASEIEVFRAGAFGPGTAPLGVGTVSPLPVRTYPLTDPAVSPSTMNRCAVM